jgi:adenylate cyclase
LAVAQRRSTASFGAADLAQLILGLMVPPLLALHVLATRGRVALGAGHANYGLMLVIYWKLVPFYGLKQVLVVTIAWLHGCLGLYGWLRLHRWWPAVAGFLYPLAFGLPIAALLGFVEAGKEALARYDGDPAWADTIRIGLAQLAEIRGPLAIWENGFLIAYSAALLTAFAIFVVRVLDRRRRQGQVSYVGGPTVAAARGLAILEISRQNDVPHASACSGRGRCGTCRVRVHAGLDQLSPIGGREAETLEAIKANGPDIRLACQAILTGARASVERLVPAEAEEEAARQPALYGGVFGAEPIPAA